MTDDRPDDETASTSETTVNFYQTTRRNNPEGSHLHVYVISLFFLLCPDCQNLNIPELIIIINFTLFNYVFVTSEVV
jgi:hypothetical protein